MQDLCVLMGDQILGAPLELPIFTMFSKNLILQLINLICEHMNENENRKPEKEEQKSEFVKEVV